jgi:chaperonin GroEL (HSP60 family)
MLSGQLWDPRAWTKWWNQFSLPLHRLISPLTRLDTNIEVIITNDGATNEASKLPRRWQVSSIFLPNNLPNGSTYSLWTFQQPKTEAGDGTTSVVVLAGSLLGAAEKMLQKGMHYRRGFS